MRVLRSPTVPARVSSLAMFSLEGSARTDRQNRLLAGYLAFVGGYVNSSGFVLVGTFTSHVTGNVGRLANDVASGDFSAAIGALTMIVAFYAGAFTATMMLETRFFGSGSRAYASALTAEALLLVFFTALSYLATRAQYRARDMEALSLCAAMGMQNALVTRLSGAVVRTTHLTGVVTDLGIESARWFRFWRGTVSELTRLPLVFGPGVTERPALPKILLLATIAGAFLIGALCGAGLTVLIGHLSLMFAALALCVGAAQAFRGARTDLSAKNPGG